MPAADLAAWLHCLALKDSERALSHAALNAPCASLAGFGTIAK